MRRRTVTRWRIHPISLSLSVFPLFSSLPASHLSQTVRTPVGAAGWESRHGYDRLRINAPLFFLSSDIKVGFFASRWQTGAFVSCRCRIKKNTKWFLHVFWEDDVVPAAEMHLGGDMQELQWCPPGSPPNGGIATSSRFLNLSTCSLSLLVFHCWIPIISLFLLWHDEFVHKRSSSAAAPTLSWISLAIFYLFNWLNVLFPENNNNPCTALKHAGSNPMLVLQRQLELISFVRIWV